MATHAFAQRSAAPRTVQGKVVSSDNAAIKGAIVHLKDTHSLSQKSFITDTDGTFRFGQLSSNTDYEVWAEFNGKKSSTKAISSFESKNTFVLTLEIK